MPIPARTIVTNVLRILNDEAGVRYSATHAVNDLNKAQRDIQIARPDTTATIAELELVDGYRQIMPVEAALLIDIPSNASGLRNRITKVSKELLDAVQPGWRALPAGSQIVHFMHDLRNPRMIEVYPPASAGMLIDIEYSAYPTDVPPPSGAGLVASTVNGNIGLHDQWANALEDMVLHYAYSTDLEGIGNLNLSTAYLQKASQALGVQLQSSATVAPTK